MSILGVVRILSIVARVEVMVVKVTYCKAAISDLGIWSEYGPVQVMDLNLHETKLLWIVDCGFFVWHPCSPQYYMHYIFVLGVVLSLSSQVLRVALRA